MRQSSKNNRQRSRGRRNGNGQINRNTTLDSNGPDVRLRGNAFQLYEKYVSLGNDASAAGERISAEAYYQYADHYFRVNSAITSNQEERRNNTAESDSNGAGESAPSKAKDNHASREAAEAEIASDPAEVNGKGATETEAAADEAPVEAAISAEEDSDAVEQKAS